MGIYEKTYEKAKKFFKTFRGAYFKLSDYKSLAEQQRQQIDNVFRLSDQLSSQVKGLEEYVDETVEQRTFLSNELANTQTQVADTQKQLAEYQQGVANTSEYKEILGEKTILEAKVGGLEEQVKKLDDLCRRRHKTICEYRKRDRKKIEQIDVSYKQRAEGPDKKHSYIIIREHSKIIASTPEFRKSLNYNDPDKPIEGLNLFNVLKIAENCPDYISRDQMREFLKNPKEIKKTTTIIDGKGEEKIIRFVKHVPENFQVGKYSYFYTRAEFYEIGFVERGLRKLHIISEPKTILEFLKKQAIDEEITAAEQEKNRILSGETGKTKSQSSWFGLRTKKQDKKE